VIRTIARALFSIPQGCGKLPLFAALGLVAFARFGPVLADDPPPRPTIALPERPPDFEIIDSVLARRAPDLGLTLRTQVADAIADEAVRAGYDPLLILAIIDVESDFVEGAVSPKGARGLMQIQPSTLHFLSAKMGLRLSREEVASDPALCVRLGIRYLRALQDKFGSLDLALMAYNAGPAKIRRAMKKPKDLEVFSKYPRLVRSDFRRFRQHEGLDGDWALARRAPLPEETLP
jgi:hypothetical protein